MHKQRAEAEAMRAQGYSYKLINQKLGVSVSTMSYWFKDKPYEPNKIVQKRIKNNQAIRGIRNHNRRVREIKQLKQQGIQELGELTERDLWLLGLGIYIGEGSKSTEIIRVSNSNPDIIRLSIKWFKVICKIPDECFAIRLHIYPDNDPDKCTEYWRGVTGLKDNNFRKFSIDKRTDKNTAKQHKLPYGTAHITVLSNGDLEKGVRLYRRINGWMAGALNRL